MPNPNLFQICGLLICFGVLAWVSVQLLHGLQQLHIGHQQFLINQEQLRQQLAKTRQAASPDACHWDGYRKFRIKWKIRESDDCHSLLLVPHDGEPLPPFLPGQYLTLRLRLPGENKPLVRCYSLSDEPRDDYYRLTVKQFRATDGGVGRASTYLTTVVQEGDILDVAAPKGTFHLQASDDGPVVFLAAGIGITPLFSMLKSIVTQTPGRELYLFYGVRNGRAHTFKESLHSLAQSFPQLCLCSCYSQPEACDIAGRDFNVHGRVTIDLIRKRLPSSNFDYFICGPSPFTSDLKRGLEAWQVPPSAIHFEMFGPAAPQQRQNETGSIANSSQHSVEFVHSRRTATWNGQHASLLELAEANGVDVDSGCRSGNCGTCVLAIRKGSIRHTTEPGVSVDAGTCLACIASPESRLEVDA